MGGSSLVGRIVLCEFTQKKFKHTVCIKLKGQAMELASYSKIKKE